MTARHAERMAALFRGLDRAYGVALPTGKTSGKGKTEARYATRQGALPDDAWARHLAGEEGLVVHPLRDDGTVLFGAIDVDVYPLDIPAIAKRIDDLNFPLVVCQTKSYGAHLYLFLSEPAPAEDIQKCLMDWAVAVGYPRVEVFPKQIELASDQDVGNGINAPYFDAAQTTRHAVGVDGTPLTLDQFLDRAEALRTDPATLDQYEVATPEDLEEAPPCLQHWAEIGIGEGQRNDVMFDFAVYAKKRWPDGWQQKFEDLNRRYCDPPLTFGEVGAIVKSVAGKKDYLYKSKCEGPYCQPQICRRREHGKGGGYDDPGVVVDSLTVITTEPRTWIVTVNGRRVEMTTEQFDDQKQFRRRVLEQLLIPMRHMKPAAWHKQQERLMANKEVIEAPEDASPRGQLETHLNDFIDKSPARDQDHMLAGRAWANPEEGRVYFRSGDFLAFLKKQRIAGYRERDIYNMVRDLGGGDLRLTIRGQQRRCWWVPADVAGAAAPLAVPDVSGGDADDVPF